jgi:tetratricopeptide (TPR) repeat protein
VLAGYDWAGLFYVRAYAGHKEAALAMLDERRGDLPRRGQANTWGAWTMLLAVVEGLAVLGEGREAAKLYPLVLEAIDSGPIMLWFSRLLQTAAGIAAACGGQWEKAEEHYQTALRLAHELPVVIEQPEVRRWYARMLVDRSSPGDRDKARRLLTEAIAMYSQIGMPKHQEMAQALLSSI